MGHYQSVFLFFGFSYLNVQLVDKILPTLVFEQQISGVGSNRSTIWATTTALASTSLYQSDCQGVEPRPNLELANPTLSGSAVGFVQPIFSSEFFFVLRIESEISGSKIYLGRVASRARP